MASSGSLFMACLKAILWTVFVDIVYATLGLEDQGCYSLI